MHRSRWASVIIDCQTGSLAEAAAFWSGAFGMPIVENEVNELYAPLRTRPGEPNIEVQKVDHPSRAHLDIETDDIEAETRRLEKLGAVRIGRIKRWQVMEAPTGQRFCVVPPQRPDFLENANVWRDETA